ncbi:recombinase RecT [Methylosinus sporium]|nr:recombinase RecT [Methylosinus sporium]
MNAQVQVDNAQALAPFAPPPGSLQALTVVNNGVGFQVVPQNFMEMVKLGDLMARSGGMIRSHFRENPGACVAIANLALRWGMDPWTVANKSYYVNDQTAFEAQLVSAIILTCAPIVGRPKYEWSGEGEERKCKVSVLGKDGEIYDYETPQLRKIKKKSPLWTDDPDQQLGYYGIRAMARRHFPDVLLGVYDREEIEYSELPTFHNRESEQRLRANEMAERLARANAAPAIGAAGYDAKIVERGTAEIEGKASPAPQGEPEKPKEERKPRDEPKPAGEPDSRKASVEPQAKPDYPALVEDFRVRCEAFSDKDALEHFVSDFGEHEDDAWYGDAPNDVLDQIDEIANARVKAIYAEGQARAGEVDEVMGTSAPAEDEPSYSELLLTLEADLTGAKTEGEVNEIAARNSGEGSWYVSAPADVKAIAEKLVLDNTLRTREADKAAAPAPAAEKPKRAPRAKAEEKPTEKAVSAVSAASTAEAAIWTENPDLLGNARLKASRGKKRFKMWLNSISQHDFELLAPFMAELEKTAAAAVVEEL